MGRETGGLEGAAKLMLLEGGDDTGEMVGRVRWFLSDGILDTSIGRWPWTRF